MAQFVGLAGTTWHDIRVTRHGVDNHNLVLARTSDICQSHSADSYLGLLAYTLNGGKTIGDTSEIPALVGRLKELILRQGSPGTDLSTKYESPVGPSAAPIVVMYEHQFLDYQAKYRAEHGRLDDYRVLLYPDTQMVSEPHFVALNHKADRLGDLLKDDPELRRREAQLGYHTFGTDELGTNIRKLHVPDPDTTRTDQTDRTAAQMPDYPLLEQLINSVKSCPPPVTD
ncbi:hypothetical protein ACJ6WF_01660 [Streptomyces sp. MMS24-I2-30]|uniref:hypothetical protein n=1 Tax=Streptomyces sp. MMS24-I2-30 TaxID=3351564 RepID=UPI00389691B0